MAHQRKSTIQAIFLHSKQQKPYQGPLRTQEPTPIGSETSLGPSMDPTGPLKQMVPDTSKDSDPSQQKSRKCVFLAFFEQTPKKVISFTFSKQATTESFVCRIEIFVILGTPCLDKRFRSSFTIYCLTNKSSLNNF